MEFYTKLGLLEDASSIAEIFEETQCCDLLNVIRLFDNLVAERIENILRGATT